MLSAASFFSAQNDQADLPCQLERKIIKALNTPESTVDELENLLDALQEEYGDSYDLNKGHIGMSFLEIAVLNKRFDMANAILFIKQEFKISLNVQPSLNRLATMITNDDDPILSDIHRLLLLDHDAPRFFNIYNPLKETHPEQLMAIFSDACNLEHLPIVHECVRLGCQPIHGVLYAAEFNSINVADYFLTQGDFDEKIKQLRDQFES